MHPFRPIAQWLVTLSCSLAMTVNVALAQTLGRTITIVVPFTPGSNTVDIIARIIGEEMKQRLGQPVIIDNKPGASGNIGAQAVATAAPDGHTLLMSGSPLTQNAGLFKDLPYDPLKSFSPIIYTSDVNIALVVHPSIPVTSARTFVEYLKDHPGQFNYSSPGHGTPHHLSMELFKLATETSMQHVPARGSAPAVQDLVGGHVSAMFLPISVAAPLAESKQIKLLAVASPSRLKVAPDVPTLAEQGIKGVEVVIWYGMLGPAGMPSQVVERYNGLINEILRSPEVAEKFAKQGIDTVGGTAGQFNQFIAEDLKKWLKIVEDAGIAAK
ncbi:tripartite tricarboxylate transporter substrate binding protein [Bradyrhizobium sp. LHD-71]|uniref:Bug family tripartite tricarboxylate transporter substrate binding protein n=1 Tax=Bradyrhizobium sp. LHD-71 TaxID=3072141 RepID=UPI00280F4A41|nr:tripartite tricarboxylate transporter substrate binding protein [Bradyrhizobium sp. LHD-71]MDQ8729805.1 tripartite tricarboxylate transporter substrate binding protein [Bradyrhizobium sp. LHD-71]